MRKIFTINKSSRITLFGFAVVYSISIHAQESVNASGKDATGSGGTVAYSIGQLVYTTNTGGTGSSAQGVQHAYEVLTLNTKEEKRNIFLTAFPNPASDEITLETKLTEDEKLRFELSDQQGKVLLNEKITEEKTKIKMIEFPSAIYFINVLNNENKSIQTFKIIKN